MSVSHLMAEQLLVRLTVSDKPLHIEYHLTKKGQSLIAVFNELEKIKSLEKQ